MSSYKEIVIAVRNTIKDSENKSDKEILKEIKWIVGVLE